MITVSEFVEGGYASSLCLSSKMDPSAFRNARVVGVNGREAPRTKDFLGERPVSIMFRLARDAPADVVPTAPARLNRRCGNLVQLVFHESRSLGIHVSKAARHERGILKVIAILRHSQGGDILRGCRLDPETFENAKIVGVNGRKYKDADEMYEVIKGGGRPKAILFELAPPPPPPPSPSMSGARAMAGSGRAMSSSSSKSMSPRTASRALLKSAAFATNESVRRIGPGDDEVEKEMDRKGGGGGKAEPSAAEGRRGTFARTRDSANSLDRTRSVNRSLRDLSRESFHALKISIEEMERMNAICEMEAINSENEAYAAAQAEAAEMIRRSSGAELSAGRLGGESPVMSKARRVLSKVSWGRAGSRSEEEDVDASSSAGSFGADGQFRSVTETEEFALADDETQRRMIADESREACLNAIRDHLELFLMETPMVTYEEWIEELHPENAKSRRNVVRGKSIDHRFYVEDSDHRNLWNANLGDDGRREYVPIREYVYA